MATAGGVGLASLDPLIRPLVRPDTLAAATPEVAAAPQLVAFAGPRPPLRPEGLAPVPPETAPETAPETTPDAAIAAVPPETALPDPVADPSLAVAVADTVAAILAAAPPDPIAGATPLAIASARVPEPRPQNFAEVVASAEARSTTATATATATAAPQDASLAVIEPPAQIAPETVAPSGPVSGDVAANATLAEAIDLREVNLIGVFGRPNDRRALVRLANGRYVRVGVGDSLDGGQVAAIGDNALNYVKRGQTITIAIPNG